MNVTNEKPAKVKLPAEIKYRDLRVRDVVKCFDGVWSTAAITRIANGQVFIERPYGFTDEASGSLLIGVERFSVYADSDRTFTVLRRPSDD
jgi:hypothetical protein